MIHILPWDNLFDLKGRGAALSTPAERLNRLPPYPFALLNQRVRELTAQGHDVISLDIGSPDMPPPPHVIEALHAASSRPNTHGYAGYKGTTGFREAVARYYERRFSVKIDPERNVLPLLGSKEGIVNLSLAYLDRGDFALVPDIGYPSYSMGAYLAGGDVCWFPLRVENDYRTDFSDIPPEAARTSKLLWVNFPCNPTGATVDGSFYQQAVNFCRQHGLLLASDNPYVEVTYDGYAAGSALQADGALECAIEFISFSKSYNMAGWRLGAAVGAETAIRNLLQVKSNIDSGHFHAIYEAGIAALDRTTQAWLDERNAVYRRRRDRILATLPHIGLEAKTPKGSLYVWAKVQNSSGADYAEQALLQAHVSIAPGSMYGPGGTNYVRFSFGTPDDRLEQALERLKKWYQSQ